MQSQNPLLDDLARLFSGALGVAAGMRSEVEAQFRQQFERILGDMDLVTREDFDVVREMVAKAREEQERLTERLASLEERLARLESTGGQTAGRARRKAAGGAGRSGGGKSPSRTSRQRTDTGDGT